MVSTKGLDYPSRGLPATTIFDESDSSEIDTGSMDYPDRGLPEGYIYAFTGTAPAGTAVLKGLIMTNGFIPFYR